MSTAKNALAAADWFETHPLDDVEVHITATRYSADVFLWPETAEALRETRRAIGHMDKEPGLAGGLLLRAARGDLRFTVWPPAGSCRQVKVGTKVEMVAKEVSPAETVEVEEEVDVYEWECDGVLEVTS